MQTFWFCGYSAKGSNIILKKELSGKTIGTVVPNHKELKMGTLKGVLELAEVEEKDFSKFL